MESEYLKTRYMILRKTPWSESSLIVSGISPDYGRLDFLWRGACITGGKNFPAAELFREFEIQFRESRRSGCMPHLMTHDLIGVNDGVANHVPCYMASCEFAQFMLRNAKPMLEMPLSYQALVVFMKRMSRMSSAEPWLSLAKYAYLHENGFLPEPRIREDAPESDSSRQYRIMERLLQYALTDTEPADETPDKPFWKKFCRRIQELSEYHELENQ